MLKILEIDASVLKGVQLCACSYFSAYTTNLFTCRLTYLAPFARAQFLVAISFFFLSFFLTICFFFHVLNAISTKLGQNSQWVSGYKIYQHFDLKGHVGVTGVKKVNHVKNVKTAPI